MSSTCSIALTTSWCSAVIILVFLFPFFDPSSPPTLLVLALLVLLVLLLVVLLVLLWLWCWYIFTNAVVFSV